MRPTSQSARIAGKKYSARTKKARQDLPHSCPEKRYLHEFTVFFKMADHLLDVRTSDTVSDAMQITPTTNISSIFAQLASSISQYTTLTGDSEGAVSNAAKSANASSSSQPPTAPSFNPSVPGAGANSTVWTISSGSDVRFSYGVSSPCAPASYPWIALSSQDVGLAEAATGDRLESLSDGQYNVVKSNGQTGNNNDIIQLNSILTAPLLSGSITAANFANSVENLQQIGTPLTQSGISAAYNYISALVSSQDDGQTSSKTSVSA
jgi:hypothetical protein